MQCSRPVRTILGPFITSKDSVNSIRDHKCRLVTLEVLDTFIGPPPQEDSNLIKQKEACLTLARRVFHPKEAWPLKEGNANHSKYLSLVKEQRKELESYLKQDKFFNPLEKQASLKGAMDFRAVSFLLPSKLWLSSRSLGKL